MLTSFFLYFRKNIFVDLGTSFSLLNGKLVTIARELSAVDVMLEASVVCLGGASSCCTASHTQRTLRPRATPSCMLDTVYTTPVRRVLQDNIGIG